MSKIKLASIALIVSLFFVSGCDSYAIWQATCAGNMEKVKSILASNPKAVNSRVFNAAQDYKGNTPLHYAAVTNHKNIAEYLILKGADINAKNDMGDTPLHKTVYVVGSTGPDKVDMAEFLLKKGANPNAQGYLFLTPLHLAAGGYSSREMGRILILYGADVNVKSVQGLTPLHLAAGRMNKDMIELLIASGANINAQDAGGFTPLHFAAMSCIIDNVKLLVASGANVNARGVNGFTPLHILVQEESPSTSEVMAYLIAHGAQVNIRTNGGITMYKETNRPYLEMNIRTTNGSSGINATPNAGFTPLQIANENGRRKNADLLRKYGGI